MAFPNYYAILNVPNNASHEEIKAAYKKESLKCALAAPSFSLSLDSNH